MTLGQRISQNRKKLGLSQEALGEKLNVSRQAVYKWESDISLPDTNNLIELSKIFSVSINELIGNEDVTITSSHDNHDQQKGKQAKPNRALILVLCLVIVGLVWSLNDMKNNISNLNFEIANLSRRIDSIQGYQKQPQFDESKFNESSLTIEDIDLLKKEMTMLLRVAPKIETKDSKIVFYVNDSTFDVEKNSEQVYELRQVIPIVDKVNAGIIIKGNETIETIPMFTEDNVIYNRLFSVNVNYVEMPKDSLILRVDINPPINFKGEARSVGSDNITKTINIDDEYQINKIFVQIIDEDDNILTSIDFLSENNGHISFYNKQLVIDDVRSLMKKNAYFKVKVRIEDSLGRKYSYIEGEFKYVAEYADHWYIDYRHADSKPIHIDN
ncbi:helix-turn-helix transcriptional regulator [Erysipelothrix sp. HDW6A]|uniref:helix-turn-helix domain-containing protein n=1 Tax=Erysipelothrix sp. HDW6A TaxID=2714928 RepID=UPI00140D692E|nr:helix-turn-helix transcriptional regulator [Erysipelothrix sp. HDW6A]QIK57220.1 helix-turn-helix transcriptional regulator [Erysipelothrix sp. HDW6A]